MVDDDKFIIRFVVLLLDVAESFVVGERCLMMVLLFLFSASSLVVLKEKSLAPAYLVRWACNAEARKNPIPDEATTPSLVNKSKTSHDVLVATMFFFIRCVSSSFSHHTQLLQLDLAVSVDG